MSVSAIKARWGLFGHVMRMAHDTPAQMAIDEYITPTAGWQGRPRTTLPTTLDNDLQQARLATFKNICIRQKSMAYPSPGNYESGTTETDSLTDLGRFRIRSRNQRTNLNPNPDLIPDSESCVVESDLESESCRLESESDSHS